MKKLRLSQVEWFAQGLHPWDVNPSWRVWHPRDTINLAKELSSNRARLCYDQMQFNPRGPFTFERKYHIPTTKLFYKTLCKSVAPPTPTNLCASSKSQTKSHQGTQIGCDTKLSSPITTNMGQRPEGKGKQGHANQHHRVTSTCRCHPGGTRQAARTINCWSCFKGT